jgi:transposase
MIGMMDRLKAQILLEAGHTQAEIAEHVHISERSVRTIGQEPPIALEALLDPPPGRGRPSKVEPFRNRVAALLTDEPALLSLEVVRRMRRCGCRATTGRRARCTR